MTNSTERSHKRVPDFFIVGHGKSGTTALWGMLRGHPQLHMPNKEPWFLADELHPPAAQSPRPIGTGSTPDTLEEYLALFEDAKPDQLIGEASSLYLWSATAAGNIAKLAPDARIIAVLREPASFLRSLHFQFVQIHVEPEKDLRKAIQLEEQRRNGQRLPRKPYWPNATFYSQHVRYLEQLRRYYDLFAPERILVLIYEDYRRDNEATIRQVQRFLEVDDTQPVNVKDANPTVSVRSSRLYALAHTLASGQGALPRAVQGAAKTLAPPRMTRQAAVAIRDRVLFSSPPPPDDELMIELRRRFKPEVVALSEYLKRDLVTLWGYDDLG
jgi:Sulfotransferase family